MAKILAILIVLAFLGGCAEIPIKDGELTLNANTSATMEDTGVAKVINRF